MDQFQLMVAVLQFQYQPDQFIFGNLIGLIGEIFKASFEIGIASEFEKWLSSDESGWFFLDSVDEARL